jgi:hypothetical protein
MIDQFLSGDLIQVIVSSIIKKVNQKTKNFYIEIRIVCLCNLERHYVQLLYSVTLTMLVLVRDYSAALPSDSIFFLLEPWDVRELYIRKTTDLPLQLLVGTFPRFVAIRFYFLSETLI